MALTITFEEIKYYYEKKYWTKENVGLAVEKGKITEEQYKEITGENYK